MPIDTVLIGALHVEYLERHGLREGEHPHHTLFQTSTIEALLDGDFYQVRADGHAYAVDKQTAPREDRQSQRLELRRGLGLQGRV
jgi:hypothetical protein